MSPRPSSSKRAPAFLKFLFVVEALRAGAAFAQTAVVEAPEIRIPNEAEACEQALAQIHSSGLAERLQKIVWDDQRVDEVVRDMRSSGQIADAETEALVRAQLKVGVLFARQGLLHEAIYQVFVAKYKTADQIREALKAFGQISTAKAQAALVAEIIERALQFVPDVDGTNLNQIDRTAKFLGMTSSALGDFKDRWILYDNDDQFALLLQNGIASLMTSATTQLADDVLARGGFFRRVFGQRNTLPIPDKPFVTNEKLTEREVREQDRPYYDTASYLEYLRRSSSAARRFFVMSRLAFLTREQIQIVLDNTDAWWLKPSLIETLRREDRWREGLVRKFRVKEALKRDLDAAEGTLLRKETGESFDSIQVGNSITELRALKGAGAVSDSAVKIIETVRKAAPARDFVSTVFNVLAALPEVHGSYRETFAVVEAAVSSANMIGLDERQVGKVKRDLSELTGHLSGTGLAVARARIEDIKVAPSYTKMSVEQLRELIPPLSESWRAAAADSDRAYARTER